MKGELWFVRDHEGKIPYLDAPQGRVQPFFSSREKCEDWILSSGLEQHLAVVLETRMEVSGFLQEVERYYDYFTLDPPSPSEIGGPSEARIAPISTIINGFIVGFMP